MWDHAGLRDFLPSMTKKSRRMPDAVPYIFTTAEYKPASGRFVFTNTTAGNYSADDMPQAVKDMPDSLVYTFDGRRRSHGSCQTECAQCADRASGQCRLFVARGVGDGRNVRPACVRGHCYMELVDKDDDGRTVRARARAVIWASALPACRGAFLAVTGTRLRSDIKIMARVTVSYHAVYGLSLVISDINPEYTAATSCATSHEIIARLRAEGVFDLNRTLEAGPVLNRVAVVSAAGAAGYGDFIRHLYSNPRRLRFSTELFPAVLQGERTASSVIVALERIMERVDEFDCVVIIRGGGAVADLASFDDYDLAANVAQFPLPVIVGIGHERDITVLDYVAHTRVKTPDGCRGNAGSPPRGRARCFARHRR